MGWDETHLCFSVDGVVAGDLIVRDPVQGVPAGDAVVNGPCPDFLDIQDPVALLIQLGTALSSSPYSICVGIAGQTFRIIVSTPSPLVTPAVVLYLDRFTVVGDAFCTVPANPFCFSDHIRIPIV